MRTNRRHRRTPPQGPTLRTPLRSRFGGIRSLQVMPRRPHQCLHRVTQAL